MHHEPDFTVQCQIDLVKWSRSDMVVLNWWWW